MKWYAAFKIYLPAVRELILQHIAASTRHQKPIQGIILVLVFPFALTTLPTKCFLKDFLCNSKNKNDARNTFVAEKMTSHHFGKVHTVCHYITVNGNREFQVCSQEKACRQGCRQGRFCMSLTAYTMAKPGYPDKVTTILSHYTCFLCSCDIMINLEFSEDPCFFNINTTA